MVAALQNEPSANETGLDLRNENRPETADFTKPTLFGEFDDIPYCSGSVERSIRGVHEAAVSTS